MIGQALVGNVAFEQELKARLKAADLSDRCLFIGEIPSGQMPAMMQCLSLLVAPPRYEGFGMTPLEAMACGAAVVATDTGAFAEMITAGETGYVVPIGDLDALTSAVLSITEDPERLAVMGQTARKSVVENFTLTGEAAAIDKVYERLWSGERF
ncbi:MAG: glycosyltransferase [Planctomycetota bacterium]|nr:MAG: glycosyltransferase [Planctomycetota bacterium]